MKDDLTKHRSPGHRFKVIQQVRLVIMLLTSLPSFSVQAQLPYTYPHGTTWHPDFYDIITENDPSAFQSVVYQSEANAQMWDREANNNQGQWVTPKSWVFQLQYNDGITSEIRVRQRGFTNPQAVALAKKYGWMMGQIPACLRAGVKEINIMKGDALFGGNNFMKSIDITIGETSELYEKTGNMEETLVHEASHAALDYLYQQNWGVFRDKDPQFISKYAYDNPNREDISESFLLFMALQHRSNRVTSQAQTIIRSMCNRIAYYSGMNLDMYPFSENSQQNQSLFDPNAWYRLTTQWQGEGKALDIANDGRNNQPYLANTANVSGQHWRITKIGEDTYKLHTMWQGSEKVLRCVPGTDTTKPLLDYESSNVDNHSWTITPIGNGYYRLINLRYRDRSLDIINDGYNNKTQLQPSGNYTGQYWMITKIN